MILNIILRGWRKFVIGFAFILLAAIITYSQITNDVNVSFVSGSNRYGSSITDLVYSCEVKEGTNLEWLVNNSKVAHLNANKRVQYSKLNTLHTIAFLQENSNESMKSMLVISFSLKTLEHLEVVCVKDNCLILKIKSVYKMITYYSVVLLEKK